jgi:predicted nucleotidyltransferase
MDLNKFYESIPFNKDEILFLSLHGSRIAETYNEDSDYDFLMVVPDYLLNNLIDYGVKEDRSLTLKNNIDITIYTEQEFYQEIKDNSIKCLESLWLPSEHIWIKNEKLNLNFILDKRKLRVSISTISTKAAHYAKILWNKEGGEEDKIKAKKNIAHSIRYPLYGLQILEYGKIIDYTCANIFYHRIMNDKKDDWKYYYEKYIEESKKIGKLFRDKVG